MPQALRIQNTKYTPKIILDSIYNIYEISGYSMPENAYQLYKLITDWFSNNIHLIINNHIEINFKFKFISTSTLKILIEILKELEKINFIKENCIKINWYYEEDDEDMKETGEEYKEIINVPFEIKSY